MASATRQRKIASLNEDASKAAEDPVFNQRFQAKFLQLVENELITRTNFLSKLMDSRRDYYKECGYPENQELTPPKWQEYYDRHPIAARVIELMPLECWQISPAVFEDDDPNVETPFEAAFTNLSKTLRGQYSFYEHQEEEHPIWEYCKRVDIQSGIAQYGIILLGFDDGLSLNQPVAGWEEEAVPNVIWNEEALPFLQESVSPRISINSQGQLIWNALPEDEEEEEKEKINGKKKKPALPPEPTDMPGKVPTRSVFGNTNPQQGKYRDPLAKHPPTKDQGPDVAQQIQEDDGQPEYGDMTTEDTREATLEGAYAPEQDEQQEGIKLIYMRVFPENLVQISQYEQNPASPRYGQPTIYRVTINDPVQVHTGVGLPLATVEVHYSRIIHVADGLTSSEVFGTPRCRAVLNNLIDLQKIYAASGEGYWKNCFATLAAETHPQLGGDVTIDTEAIRTQMKKWRDSLDRILAATGITWRTISPQIVDPNSHVSNQLQAICIKLGCPLRVFMGSEQGVLAASEDAKAWYQRVRERRKNYLTPRLIVPLIDRLIRVGVLPPPEVSYKTKWDDEQKMLPSEQAQVANALTAALATYISGQIDGFIEPVSYLVEIWGWDRERAQAVIDATLEHITRQQEAQALQGDQYTDPMTGQPLEQDPETGQFIDPNTGEPLQQDEFGQPVMIDPQTGQPIPVQKQSPQEQQGPLGAEAQIAQGMQEQQIDPETGEPIAQDEEVELDEEGNPIPPEQAAEGLPEEVDEEGLEAEDDEAEAVRQMIRERKGLETPEEDVPSEDIDEDTGLPVDPESGYLIDPESGYLLDKETGDLYNPETGESLGNLFDEDEEVERDEQQ